VWPLRAICPHTNVMGLNVGTFPYGNRKEAVSSLAFVTGPTANTNYRNIAQTVGWLAVVNDRRTVN
jgi:hypothetical protein